MNEYNSRKKENPIIRYFRACENLINKHEKLRIEKENGSRQYCSKKERKFKVPKLYTLMRIHDYLKRSMLVNLSNFFLFFKTILKHIKDLIIVIMEKLCLTKKTRFVVVEKKINTALTIFPMLND